MSVTLLGAGVSAETSSTTRSSAFAQRVNIHRVSMQRPDVKPLAHDAALHGVAVYRVQRMINELWYGHRDPSRAELAAERERYAKLEEVLESKQADILFLQKNLSATKTHGREWEKCAMDRLEKIAKLEAENARLRAIMLDEAELKRRSEQR